MNFSALTRHAMPLPDLRALVTRARALVAGRLTKMRRMELGL